MVERVAYVLEARSPFHFGERGVGLEGASVVLHSDTLFSALCWALREMGDDLDAFLSRFPRMYKEGNFTQAEPPLLLSSAFPCILGVYLFPKPMVWILGLDRMDLVTRKKVKDVAFVSRSLLGAMLAGQSVEEHLRSGRFLQGGSVWVTAQEAQALAPLAEPLRGVQLWAEETAPRVTVDRVMNRSELYSVGRVRFPEASGLFFLVEYRDHTLRPMVEKALRALGDEGIGGERSDGHGQFRLRVVPGSEVWDGLQPEEGQDFLTLSLYWPTRDEVMAGVLQGSSYRLLQRRGWVSSPDGMNLRRWGVRMLAEGSRLCRRPVGALADVKPVATDPVPNVPHGVWRYGLAFPVLCRRMEEGNG